MSFPGTPALISADGGGKGRGPVFMCKRINFLRIPLLTPTQLQLWNFILPKILVFTKADEFQGLSEICKLEEQKRRD